MCRIIDDVVVLVTEFLCCFQVSPRLFFILGEQGLDTLMVVWQSALNSAFFSIPDRLLVLVAASHDPHGPNLYLQSSDGDHRQFQVNGWTNLKFKVLV